MVVGLPVSLVLFLLDGMTSTADARMKTDSIGQISSDEIPIFKASMRLKFISHNRPKIYTSICPVRPTPP